MEQKINFKLVRRRVQQMGLAEAAIATGLSLALLSKIKAGTYKHHVSYKNLQKMATGLGVSIEELCKNPIAS